MVDGGIARVKWFFCCPFRFSALTIQSSLTTPRGACAASRDDSIIRSFAESPSADTTTPHTHTRIRKRKELGFEKEKNQMARVRLPARVAGDRRPRVRAAHGAADRGRLVGRPTREQPRENDRSAQEDPIDAQTVLVGTCISGDLNRI